MPEVLGQCPVCRAELVVTREQCVACGTALEGRFQLPRLLRLSPEQLQFVELFVRCRGVIRDLERELGVSYPTVRSRLDEVVTALRDVEMAEYAGAERDERGPEDEDRPGRRSVLDELAGGTISLDEAIARLRQGGRSRD